MLHHTLLLAGQPRLAPPRRRLCRRIDEGFWRQSSSGRSALPSKKKRKRTLAPAKRHRLAPGMRHHRGGGGSGSEGEEEWSGSEGGSASAEEEEAAGSGEDLAGEFDDADAAVFEERRASYLRRQSRKAARRRRLRKAGGGGDGQQREQQAADAGGQPGELEDDVEADGLAGAAAAQPRGGGPPAGSDLRSGRERQGCSGLESDLESDLGSEEEEEEEEDVVFEGGYRLPADVWNRLFDYQRTAVKWMWELHTQRAGGIIGDEMVGAWDGGGGRPRLGSCCWGLLLGWRQWFAICCDRLLKLACIDGCSLPCSSQHLCHLLPNRRPTPPVAAGPGQDDPGHRIPGGPAPLGPVPPLPHRLPRHCAAPVAARAACVVREGGVAALCVDVMGCRWAMPYVACNEEHAAVLTCISLRLPAPSTAGGRCSALHYCTTARAAAVARAPAPPAPASFRRLRGWAAGAGWAVEPAVKAFCSSESGTRYQGKFCCPEAAFSGPLLFVALVAHGLCLLPTSHTLSTHPPACPQSDCGILLTTYETMRLQRGELVGVDWGYVVLDEGHKIRWVLLLCWERGGNNLGQCAGHC